MSARAYKVAGRTGFVNMHLLEAEGSVDLGPLQQLPESERKLLLVGSGKGGGTAWFWHHPRQPAIALPLVEDGKEYSERIKALVGRQGLQTQLDLLEKTGRAVLEKVKAGVPLRDVLAQPGVTFAAYAAIRIRGAIVDYLRSASNLCRATIQIQRKVDAASRKLEQKLMRAPTEAEIAQALDMTAEDLARQRAETGAGQVMSLDDVYTDHSLIFRDGNVSAEDRLELGEMKRNLARAVSELPEREQLVIQLYYVEELNVYEVAEVLGVTTGRVSQIKKSAVTHLREAMDRLEKETAGQ